MVKVIRVLIGHNRREIDDFDKTKQIIIKKNYTLKLLGLERTENLVGRRDNAYLYMNASKEYLAEGMRFHLES